MHFPARMPTVAPATFLYVPGTVAVSETLLLLSAAESTACSSSPNAGVSPAIEVSVRLSSGHQNE